MSHHYQWDSVTHDQGMKVEEEDLLQPPIHSTHACDGNTFEYVVYKHMYKEVYKQPFCKQLYST